MEMDGVGFIVTANEGADMELEAGSDEWTESQRGKDFVEGERDLKKKKQKTYRVPSLHAWKTVAPTVHNEYKYVDFYCFNQ